MLYNLAEWAKEHLPEWLEQSIVERSMPAAASTVDPVAYTSAKEVPLWFHALQTQSACLCPCNRHENKHAM